jgi:hypothetical protein
MPAITPINTNAAITRAKIFMFHSFCDFKAKYRIEL